MIVKRFFQGSSSGQFPFPATLRSRLREEIDQASVIYAARLRSSRKAIINRYRAHTGMQIFDGRRERESVLFAVPTLFLRQIAVSFVASARLDYLKIPACS